MVYVLAKDNRKLTWTSKVECVLKIWTAEPLFFLTLGTPNVPLLEEDQDSCGHSSAYSSVVPLHTKAVEAMDFVFQALMIVTSFILCIGYASHQAANSMGFMAVVMNAYGLSVDYAYTVGSIGISLGMLILGYKVMRTVGLRVVKLDFAKGYCAQFSTAIVNVAGSCLGLPNSTSHSVLGALIGLGISYRLASVAEVYLAVAQKGSDEEMAFGGRTVGKIILWGAFGIPMSILMGFGIANLII